MDNVKQFPQQPGVKQIQVDLKNATQRTCQNMIGDHSGIGTVTEHMCGCKYFMPVVAVYTVSALLSPTGQELIA
jgi:hypothetical protein